MGDKTGIHCGFDFGKERLTCVGVQSCLVA